jgi:hypothetical protein
MDLLDPKQDVVFKLLFADKRNERLLISLIDSVLEPKSSIQAVALAKAFAMPVTDERQRELAEADTARLESIAKHLQDHRTWP